MKRSTLSLFVVVLLTVLLIGCAPAPTPIPPTDTPSPIPPTMTAQPSATATETLVPSPTPLPGKVLFSVDTLGKSIPWLPLDKTAMPGVNFVGFNTVKRPFNSTAARQAFAYSVDRTVILEMAARYKAINTEAATTLTPPQTLGRDLYGDVGINYDPSKAQALLAEAGYTDPSSFPKVLFLVNASGDIAPGARFNMATAMPDMWKTTLGVQVEVQAIQNFNSYGNRLRNDPPDLFWLGWRADYNDPANFTGSLFSPNGDYGGQYNYGHFSNSEFNQLVDKAAKTTDPAVRQELYIQAERILCETEAGIIPIYHSTYR